MNNYTQHYHDANTNADMRMVHTREEDISAFLELVAAAAAAGSADRALHLLAP